MVCPLVFRGFIDFCKLVQVPRSGELMAFGFGNRIHHGSVFLRHSAEHVDCDCGKSAVVPHFDPRGVSCAASSVDEHDSGSRIFFGRSFRHSIPCKNSGRSAVIFGSCKEHAFHPCVRRFEAFRFECFRDSEKSFKIKHHLHLSLSFTFHIIRNFQI